MERGRDTLHCCCVRGDSSVVSSGIVLLAPRSPLTIKTLSVL